MLRPGLSEEDAKFLQDMRDRQYQHQVDRLKRQWNQAAIKSRFDWGMMNDEYDEEEIKKYYLDETGLYVPKTKTEKMKEGKPMVESQPVLKELAADPKKAIEWLANGCKLKMEFAHGNRTIYIFHPGELSPKIFPTNIFNSLRELQLIKEEKEDIFIYNE